MAKASRETSALRREQVLLAASEKVRERGLGKVSVPELMADAGLTHGGFYKYFASKEALEAEACGRALEEMAERIWGLIDADPETARDALFDFYLSPDHRDRPGQGCAIAALAGDAAQAPGSQAAQTLSMGIARQTEILTALCGGDRQTALAALATLVGATVLARAAPAPLSTDVLTAAREALRA